MRKSKSHIFLTTPIYYVNAKPHIGTAYTSILVDIASRFYREIMGYNVFSSFGTDEHGLKVERAALKHEMPTQEYVDKAHMPFRELLDTYNIRSSRFIRTTDPDHIMAAQCFWNKLVENDFIYESTYSGWYSESDEAYYSEKEIADGRSIETGSEVKFMEEQCMFFNMQKIKNRLLEHYIKNPDFITPKSRYNEALNILKSDLPDLAISRSKFAWGIPVPGHENQVMYVWFEALVNYLTVLGYPHNPNIDEWWAESVHFIGKDILKFHAIYWPAMLLAADLQPPKKIYAHGWLKLYEKKISKSLGNVIDPIEISQEFGIDEMRYVFARTTSYSEDSNFNYDIVKNTIETELVNEVGNLVHRILSICCNKYKATIQYIHDNNHNLLNSSDNICNIGISNISAACDFDIACNRADIGRDHTNSIIHDRNQSHDSKNSTCDALFSDSSSNHIDHTRNENDQSNILSLKAHQDQALYCLKAWDDALIESKKHMMNFNIPEYIHVLRNAVMETNRYINEYKPWSMKDPKETLGILCLCIQRLFILYRPIMPNSIEKMMDNMNITYNELSWYQCTSYPISKPKIVFSRS